MFSPARGPDMKYPNKIGSDTREGGCKGNCALTNQQFCVIIHNCHQGGEWSKFTPLLFFSAGPGLPHKKKIENCGLIKKINKKTNFQCFDHFKM